MQLIEISPHLHIRHLTVVIFVNYRKNPVHDQFHTICVLFGLIWFVWSFPRVFNGKKLNLFKSLIMQINIKK